MSPASLASGLRYVLYGLGVLWMFLFPLVCISTGELKPRGTYMSENALLPGSNKVQFDSQARERAARFAEEVRASGSPAEGVLREFLIDVAVRCP